MDAALDDPGPGRLSPTTADLLRVEVTVPLAVDAAFALFTGGAAVTAEPEVGGRWRLDGDEPLGAVTLWEPPTHVRLSWDGAAGHSVVDVRVADVDDELTTVIVEHRGLHHLAPEERAWLRSDDGWWAILRSYAAAARAAAAAADTPPADL